MSLHRMYLGEPCKAGAPSFLNGTTNGAAWYPLTGGMQDYHYIWHGCMEVTLELSCCKYPPASELQQFWRDNRASLLQFIGEAHRGVRGFVKDEGGTPIEGASMKVRRRIFFIHLLWLTRNCPCPFMPFALGDGSPASISCCGCCLL